ncbi:M28 family peptidase [Dethiothermospora halolimnae]|uniref:M28 family peptidase n=1 Tax=Dethiothermospora halolimnae TaxID=3114390 RepID=UPI003CCC18D8
MKTRKINYPLLIGSIILVLFSILIIFREDIIKYDPYGMSLKTLKIENGEFISKDPDMPPNFNHLFGTDLVGRDIFSQIIYGAKYTLGIGIIVAIFRLIIALPLALISGFGNKKVSKIIDFFDSFFSTIPTLIFCIIILSFNKIRDTEFSQSVTMFIIVLTVVGWARLSKLLRERTKEILNEGFITGEVATGKSRMLIATQNVVPHLTANIIINTFFEVGRALMLLASLGIFNIYVGGTIYPYRLLGIENHPLKATFEPEWGGMLGDSIHALMSKKSWIAFFPALAFFISILGFNLFAEGLKIEVNKRDSRFISHLRKIPFHLSPKTFVYEIKNINKCKKHVAIKFILIIVIVIPIIIPPPESLLKVNVNTAFGHIMEFDKDKYQGRMVGTKGRDMACKYIVDNLREYGLESYFKEGYIKTVDSIDTIGDIGENQLLVLDDNGEKIKDFKFRRDYSYTFFNTYKASYYTKENYGNILTLRNLKRKNFDRYKRYFLLLDDNKFTDTYELYDYIYNLEDKVNIRGIIMPRSPMFNYSFNKKFNLLEAYKEEPKFNAPIVLETDREIIEELKKLEGKRMICKNDIEKISGFKYKNIAAVIKGKDSSKEKLIVSTNYDYLGYDGDIKYKGLLYNGTSISATLEMAKELSRLEEKPEQDIIFLFFDGSTFKGNTGASMYLKEEGLDIFKNSFVISMNSLGLGKSDSLFFDTSFAGTVEKRYFEYSKYIEKRGEELDLIVKRQRLLYGDEDLSSIHTFGGKGIFFSSMGFNSDIEKFKDEMYATEQSDLNLIDKKLLKEQIQLILDTIIYITY